MVYRLVKEKFCESTTDDCIMEIALDNLVTAVQLKIDPSEDVKLTHVRHFVQNCWPKHPPLDTESYFRLKDEPSVFNVICVSRGTCAVIPTTMQEKVLKMAPDGHPGFVRSKQRCRDLVWWPANDRHIEYLIRDCV